MFGLSTGFVIFPLVAAMCAGLLANSKGRSIAGWAIGSFFFPFLLIVLLIVKKRPRPGVTKYCRGCMEIIDANAAKCQYCGQVS